MKKALVLGSSGATGILLVKILLQKGLEVIAIARNTDALTKIDSNDGRLTIVEASISEMTNNDLTQHLMNCQAVFSCLGHNLTFKGMYGHPRRLVTDAVVKVIESIKSLNNNNKVKIILMNTAGNSNRDIPEKPPFSQQIVISLLRALLPPHADNEEAADYLRLHVGQDDQIIEWAAVRPDGLINEDEVSPYDIHPSPTRNAIFDAGSTSRINVADFMSELAVNSGLWNKWKGKMPVIYNKA